MTPRTASASFRADQDGGLTVLSIYMFFAMLLVGGLAIDVTNATRARTQLQNAADIAGNMALYWRERYPEAEAKIRAIEMAVRNMPERRFGEVLTPEDIVFGTWDGETGIFTPEVDSRAAVQVHTRRIATRENALSTFLMKLVSVDTIDLGTPSTWATYDRGCLREGFVAQGLVDLQSNNNYSDGFCIHSNTEISINQNNTFESGTVVSLPGLDALDLPRSGFELNEGLREALQVGPHLLRVFDQLQNEDGTNGPLLNALMTGTGAWAPDYYDPTKRDGLGAAIHDIPLSGGNPKITASNVEPNMINRMTCGGSGRVTVENGEILRDAIIVTNCDVNFGNGAAIENARLITTSTSSNSIKAPNGLRIGRDDDCADGGDAQIVTLGGFDVASGLEAYGAQILAMGDIVFAANANGVKGAAFTSNSQIHGTSNMDFGYCGTGAGNIITVPYFRMVR